ncbi:MAG: single-stranded DNA-binding protein [Pontiellaceae bacterium]
MASYNRVVLVGGLTRNPELRYTPSGTAVAEFGLAVGETFKNKSGESIEKVCYADIVVWDRQAETANEYLQKGSQILVEGRLQFEQWETKDGEKRSKLKIRADRIQFLNTNNSSNNEKKSNENKIESNNEFESDVPF